MPRVLITGAGRGIGLEFARQYAADGWSVVATVRNEAAAEELRALSGDEPPGTRGPQPADWRADHDRCLAQSRLHARQGGEGRAEPLISARTADAVLTYCDRPSIHTKRSR